MQPSASMTAATAAGTAADGPPAKKKRGSSGLPRGVIRTGSTKSKFQGRINYKPPGSGRGRQRAIGTFDTAEEAGLAVAEAEAKLRGPKQFGPSQHGPTSTSVARCVQCPITTSTPHLHFPPLSSAGATSGARDGAELGRV